MDINFRTGMNNITVKFSDTFSFSYECGKTEFLNICNLKRDLNHLKNIFLSMRTEMLALESMIKNNKKGKYSTDKHLFVNLFWSLNIIELEEELNTLTDGKF